MRPKWQDRISYFGVKNFFFFFLLLKEIDFDFWLFVSSKIAFNTSMTRRLLTPWRRGSWFSKGSPLPWLILTVHEFFALCFSCRMENCYRPYFDPEFESLIDRIHPPRSLSDTYLWQMLFLADVSFTWKKTILTLSWPKTGRHSTLTLVKFLVRKIVIVKIRGL